MLGVQPHVYLSSPRAIRPARKNQPVVPEPLPDLVQVVHGEIGGVEARIGVLGQPLEAMQAADLCLTSSGTTTLEIAASGTPFVLGYRVSPIVYFLGRMLISVEHIGLVNLVAGRRLVPEHVGARSFANGAARDLNSRSTQHRTRAPYAFGTEEV